MNLLFLLAMSVHASAAVVPPAERLFPPRETLEYTLRFADTLAGELKMETLEPTTFEGRPAHHFRGSLRTVKFIAMLYPYEETVDLYYDRETRLPLYIDVRVQERKKLSHTQIRLDPKTLRGTETEDSTEPGEAPRHRKKFWDMASQSQSLFSILQYLRVVKLGVGKTVRFPVSHDEKNVTFAATVVREGTVSTVREERSGWLLRIDPEFSRGLFHSAYGEPEIWLSADAQHSLLRFELPHKFGRVVAVLKSHAPGELPRDVARR